MTQLPNKIQTVNVLKLLVASIILNQMGIWKQQIAENYKWSMIIYGRLFVYKDSIKSQLIFLAKKYWKTLETSQYGNLY